MEIGAIFWSVMAVTYGIWAQFVHLRVKRTKPEWVWVASEMSYLCTIFSLFTVLLVGSVGQINLPFLLLCFLGGSYVELRIEAKLTTTKTRKEKN